MKLRQYLPPFERRYDSCCQHVISELIQAVISQVDIPLEVSKLEGDAIFLYAIKGSDVILVHRLLENSAPNDEYLLMTEPAIKDIGFPHQLQLDEGSETYEHLGQVKTFVYTPRAE